MNENTLNTSSLIEECKKERIKFYGERETNSPACIELFKRAFASDQEAWNGVITIFTPLVESWLRNQHQVDVEDLIQDTWFRFSRHAAQNNRLVESKDIASLLKYLHLTANSALVQTWRRREMKFGNRLLEEDKEVRNIPLSNDFANYFDLRASIEKRLAELLGDEIERQIFYMYYELQMKPLEIFQENQDKFKSYEEVAKIIQRIRRRLLKDPVLRDLSSTTNKDV